jgi:hypothetical protein
MLFSFRLLGLRLNRLVHQPEIIRKWLDYRKRMITAEDPLLTASPAYST